MQIQYTFLEYLLQARCWDTEMKTSNTLPTFMKLKQEELGKPFKEGTLNLSLIGQIRFSQVRTGAFKVERRGLGERERGEFVQEQEVPFSYPRLQCGGLEEKEMEGRAGANDQGPCLPHRGFAFIL